MKKLHTLKRKIINNRSYIASRVIGYSLLAICTVLFSLSCAMGKFNAAVQFWMFCTALLVVL